MQTLKMFDMIDEYTIMRTSMNNAISTACTGRRLFVTEKGFIGVGPAELEVGDCIYVLAGGNYPYILRPVEAAERLCTFELVGHSYVHEIL